jgi:hypothetical protein
VLDHLRSNRALALQVAGFQVSVSVLAGLVGSAFGGSVGLAALLGGLSVALGQSAMAWLSLGGGVQSPRGAFLRLLLGMLCKWLLVVLVWVVAMPFLGRAPLAGLLGLAAAMVAYPMAVLFAAKVKREH